MLKVKGESMINAGIFDGDFILVEETPTASDNDIIVALLEDSVTVKRFFKEEDHIRLQPENDTMEPIIVPQDSPFSIVVESLDCIVHLSNTLNRNLPG